MPDLASINISRGGVPKEPVFDALITATGVAGDRQRDLRYHGGPDRAVVLYSLDLIAALQREGHFIATGTTGENLTISGLEWPAIVPGLELKIGAVRLIVTSFASPCEKIRRSFIGGDFRRILQGLHPGWSRVCARVIAGGIVSVGDCVTL